MTCECPGCTRLVTREGSGFAKCSACGCDFYITPEGMAVACVDVSKLPGVRMQEYEPTAQQAEETKASLRSLGELLGVWHGPSMADIERAGRALHQTQNVGTIPELETLVDRHVPAVTDTFLCVECKQQFSDVETDAHCAAHSTRNPHFTDSRRRRFCNCCAELYAQVANSPYWVRMQQMEVK